MMHDEVESCLPAAEIKREVAAYLALLFEQAREMAAAEALASQCADWGATTALE